MSNNEQQDPQDPPVATVNSNGSTIHPAEDEDDYNLDDVEFGEARPEPPPLALQDPTRSALDLLADSSSSSSQQARGFSFPPRAEVRTDRRSSIVLRPTPRSRTQAELVQDGIRQSMSLRAPTNRTFNSHVTRLQQ